MTVRAGLVVVASLVLWPVAAAQADTTPPAGKARPQVKLVWVGDMALSASDGLPSDGGRSLFTKVKADLQADLTVGNLEGTLGSGGTRKCGPGSTNCFSFQAPSSYARVFGRAGFNVLNTANNHAFDYGAVGQSQTLAALDAAKIAHTGRPGEITVVRSNGIRVAFVGFAPYGWAANLTDIPAARALVARAREHADVVVVLMHAGAEGANQRHTPFGNAVAFGENRGNTRAFAHAAVDAGAALVLGSGPHVVRGIERYKHGLIAYSLGNFAASHTLGLNGVLGDSAILSLDIGAKGALLAGRWTSVHLNPPGVPVPDPGHRSLKIMRAVSRQDFGKRAIRATSTGRLLVGKKP
jgi:hypothetical protein